MSGRFSPLTAPLRSSDFLARSAPFSAQLTLRSNALVVGGQLHMHERRTTGDSEQKQLKLTVKKLK